MTDHRILLADLRSTEKNYEEIDPRGLCYRVWIELVALALDGRTSLTSAETLAYVLHEWNKIPYCRFKTLRFDGQHIDEIERLLRQYQRNLAVYRRQKIEELDLQMRTSVLAMFKDFENVFCRVGAAKALHLLAPGLFPPWDTKIIKGHGLKLKGAGTNGERYWRFILLVRDQCLDLRRQGAEGNLLKLIDQYNICRYTRKAS